MMNIDRFAGIDWIPETINGETKLGKKLVITLDEQTTQKYLELANKRTVAELEADCEPSGVNLTIEIGSDAYPHYVYLDGKDIGEASVDLK